MRAVLPILLLFVCPFPSLTTAGAILTVCLDVHASEQFWRELMPAALIEAGAIWAPHGVVLITTAPTPLLSTPAALRVRTSLTDSGRRLDGTQPMALGETMLGPGDRSNAAIAIYLDAITASAKTVPYLGVPETRWSSTLRRAVYARVLGRTLAHEVGHVIFNTTAHQPTGLMSATHATRQLAEVDPAPFRLTEPERERLALVTALH